MAKRDETLTTERSAEQALTAGKETMESLGLKVNQIDSNTLEGKAGSKLMVYWIGLLLPASSYPVKVNYTVSPNNGGSTITMHTESNVFLSFYVWKYKARAGAVADALKQGVAAKLG